MLESQIRSALRATIAAGGDEADALRALRPVDPLLRPLARRRLRQALDAELRSAPAGREESSDLLLRRVYLRLRAVPAPDEADGPLGLRSTYARVAGEDARRPARGPWASAALVALLLLGALASLGPAVFDPGARPGAASPPLAPTGAYLRGGRPCEAGPTLRRIFREDLAALVIALDRRRHPDTRIFDPAELHRAYVARRRALLGPKARDALGPVVFDRLEALVEAAARVSEVSEAGLRRAIARFLAAVVATNDALAAGNLGIFLDGDVLEGAGERRVMLASFTVERVLVHRSGDERLRTLLLRRLDRLNLRHNLLGFTRPGQREALVLLDEVQGILVRDLLPAVGAPALPMVDDATRERGATWALAVERRAAEVVRRGLAALPGADRGALDRLGALLRERAELLSWWRALLADRGVAVADPDGLTLDARDRALLGRLLPKREVAAFDRVQRALLAGESRAQLEELTLAFAEAVARHELQHRLDYGREARWEVPAPLARLVGRLRDRAGQVRPFARRATHELSATLAEIARDPHAPHLALTLAARTLLDRDFRDRLEVTSARVVLEGLDDLLSAERRPSARRLGPSSRVLETHPTLAAEPGTRSLDREALAARYLRLTRVPPPLLRRAAVRLWAGLFSVPLPELTPVLPPRPGGEPWVCPGARWTLPPEADGPRPIRPGGPRPSPPDGG